MPDLIEYCDDPYFAHINYKSMLDSTEDGNTGNKTL